VAPAGHTGEGENERGREYGGDVDQAIVIAVTRKPGD
jgi:hypothetical protein